MLERLSDKTHEINTAVVLLNTATQSMQTDVEVASVTFRQLSRQEISDYVATGEPLDKAGAYAIQGGAKGFVTNVEGDLDAVIGLPLANIRKWLIP
jgi:septum formation protein